jgi:hypothetical protein
MKIFWAVLLVLIAGAGAYLTLGRGERSSSAPKGVVFEPTPDPVRAPGEKDNDESAFFSAGEGASAASKSIAEKTEVELTGPAQEVKPAPGAVAAPAKPETTKPETTVPAPAAATPKETKPEAPAAPAETKKPEPAKAPTPAPTPADQAVAYGEDAKIVKNDDGSMMVDDKYPVKGAGTKADPYQITWEYLVSAQEDYQPRLGKKKLPGRMKLISGKYVRITGFVAFPVMATEPTDMLSMLNQWDGCCIGIPPTPYDAIEVKLKEAASNEERLTTYGTVEGKLKVEPYLMRDWLVSLYSMEEATMEKAQ